MFEDNFFLTFQLWSDQIIGGMIDIMVDVPVLIWLPSFDLER